MTCDKLHEFPLLKTICDLILLLIIFYWSNDVNFRNTYFTLKFFSCEAAIFNGIFGLKFTDQENCSHCYCCSQTYLLYSLFLEKRTCFILMLQHSQSPVKYLLVMNILSFPIDRTRNPEIFNSFCKLLLVNAAECKNSDRGYLNV